VGAKKQDYIDNLPPQKHSATLQQEHYKHLFIWLTASFIKVNFGCFRHHIAFNEAQHGGLRCQGSVGPEDRDMGSLVIGSGAFQNSSLAQKFSWMLSWESCSSNLPSHWVQFQAVSRILLKKKLMPSGAVATQKGYTKRRPSHVARPHRPCPWGAWGCGILNLTWGWGPMGTIGPCWPCWPCLPFWDILGNLGMPK
jgi:hypothetical protein